MGETKIEWADYTFNPWIGCTKVSAACDHCYAETLVHRYRWAKWGAGEPRRMASAAMWKNPAKWDRAAKAAGVRRRVFCASLADVFDAEVDDEWRVLLFEKILETLNLDWLLLTKRPQVAKKWFDAMPAPRNVWLGTTVEDQKMADLRIPILLSIPGITVRFLSCEPLLGPVDLTAIQQTVAPGFFGDALQWYHRGRCHEDESIPYPTIDWVITGGESGPKARPSHPDWFRSIRDRCAAAGVPLFHKQNGEWHTGFSHIGTGEPVFKQFDTFQRWVDHAPSWVNGGICLDRHGRDLKNGGDFQRAWDEGRFPVTIMHRIGKKAAGAKLDGVEHREFPEPGRKY